MSEPQPTDVADLDPPDVVETDEDPTGEPPDSWDMAAHADEPPPEGGEG